MKNEKDNVQKLRNYSSQLELFAKDLVDSINEVLDNPRYGSITYAEIIGILEDIKMTVREEWQCVRRDDLE